MNFSIKETLTKLEPWFIKLYLSGFFSLLFWTIGITLHFRLPGSLAEFITSTLSLLPISIAIQLSSEDILLHLQRAHLEIAGGVFRAVFGTFAELALSTVALLYNDVLLAQTSLTGAFLANCLVLIGLSFIAGGMHSDDMEYPILIARVGSQMLLVSLISLVLPTAFQLWYPQPENDILRATSRAAAITLLVVFGCYIAFFYVTHSRYTLRRRSPKTIQSMLSQVNITAAAPTVANLPPMEHLVQLRERSLKQPKLHPFITSVLLVISCSLCVVSSMFVISSKKVPTETLGIPENFVGLVLVPLVLSVPEQLSSLAHGREKKVEWVIEGSIASGIRIVLFILPLLVILAWIVGIDDMTLFFDSFQITIIALTIVLVNYLIRGNATWFDGVVLLCTYVLFANAAWNYPG